MSDESIWKESSNIVRYENLKEKKYYLCKDGSVVYVCDKVFLVSSYFYTFYHFDKTGQLTGIGGGHWRCYFVNREAIREVSPPAGFDPHNKDFKPSN